MTTTHLPTTRTASDSMLRLVLRLDAVASGLTGIAALAGVEFLPDLLGTPVALLVPVGIFLLVWAGALGYLASRPRLTPAAIWTVIVLNLVWVLDSVATVLTGWFPLTGIGIGYVIAQAVAVAALADLQYVGLRRIR